MEVKEKTKDEMSTLALSIPLIIYGLVTSMRFYVQKIFGYSEKLDHGTIYVVSGLFGIYFLYLVFRASSYSLAKLWKEYKSSAIPVVLFLVISFAIGGIAHGFNYRWFFLVVQFGVYGLPTVIAAKKIASRSVELQVFKHIEKMSVVILPMILVYVVLGFLNMNDLRGAKLGTLDYMQISYTVLPFILASTLLLIQKDDDESSKRRTYHTVIRICLILIYTLALLIASTRNTILCILFFLILITLYFVFNRKKVWKMGLLLALVVIIGTTSFVVYNKDSLKGFYRMNRLANYLQEVTDTFLRRTAEKDNDDKEDSRHDLDEIKKIESGELTIQGNLSKDGLLASRKQLFLLSLAEVKNNPFYGLLPLGFYNKYYPFYPHNIFLELLAEWGLFVGGGVSILIVYLVLSLLKGDHNQMMMLIFMASYIPQLMSSGSVWNSFILFFGASYALSKLAIRKRALSRN